jgi:hypothetical protein
MGILINRSHCSNLAKRNLRAPWGWFQMRPKHVGAIVQYFNMRFYRPSCLLVTYSSRDRFIQDYIMCTVSVGAEISKACRYVFGV